MAKATVQAALGPVALKHLSADDPDRAYAEVVLMVCILSIVLTVSFSNFIDNSKTYIDPCCLFPFKAPTGAILISVSGTKLLTKTTQKHNTEGK